MIILNEKEYAEECIKNGIVDKKPYKTLTLLAKYYYYHVGYRKKRIIKCLSEYMDTFYPGYKIDKQSWNDTIERIANRVSKYPLYQNDGVWITEEELNKISELNNEPLEKLSFSLLCIAKLNVLRNEKTNGWVNTDEKEIFEAAGIKCSVAQRSDYIGDLYILRMVEFAKKNTNLSVRITFMDNSKKGVLFVQDFRALGNEYLKYNGGNYIRCQECGLLVRGNRNGTKKYCDKCKGHPSKDTKIIYCEDCGKAVVVNAKNNRTSRCDQCYSDRRRSDVKANMRKMRNRRKLLSEQVKDDTF